MSQKELSYYSRIDTSINRERKRIEREMVNYQFKDGLSLKDLLIEKGGQPVRSMIATTWRSGSTFIGDIMDSHPATYYHYEPLLHYDIKQVRSGWLARDAVRTLNNLLKCDYSRLGKYLEYGRHHHWLFLHNKRLWKYCTQSAGKHRNSYCWTPDFLNRFCPLFPFQSVKTVRLRLNLTRQFVQNPKLNLKILLLVRDPRGTMQSRKHRAWCPGNPDCEDPSRLCDDLVQDYHSAKKLIVEFPDRYKVVRYEDFSMDPYNNTVDLFSFFGLSMHPQVVDFLETHTKANKGGVSSTFRDSKKAPFHWREKLSRPEVETIQGRCREALQLWGYRLLADNDQLDTFEPVLNLKNFSLPAAGRRK